MFSDDPPKIPFKAPSNVAGWLPAIGMLILAFPLSYFLAHGKGWVTACAVGALAMLVQFSWPLRKLAWFWITVMILGSFHLWAVYDLDWSWVTSGGGLKLLGTLTAADFLIMTGLIYGMYRLKYGRPAEPVEQSIDDLPRYSDRGSSW